MAKKSIERYKYECAVRQLLKYRKEWGLKEFREWATNQLHIMFWLKYQDDFIIQWRLGNRGNHGHWIG